MGNIATSIDEQLALLTERGMLIKDKEKAKEYLLDIGYYRLGFYWHHFEIDKQHNFQQGITLDTIRELYYFDVDLKYLLSKYIHRIEVHFRSQLVYLASNKYKQNAVWFVDKNVVSQNTIDFFQKFYDNRFIGRNRPINKHHTKYPNDKYAPAWKTVEFLTFGQIYSIYNSLKNEDLKNDIANTYGFTNLSAFKKHLLAIVNVRNICAHNGVLFDFNQPMGIKKIPNTKYGLNTRNSTNLNASIFAVLNILFTISENRAEDLKRDLDILVQHNQTNPDLKNIISTKVGYDIHI